MTFADLSTGDTVLYLYDYTSNPNSINVGVVTGDTFACAITDIYSTHPYKFTTGLSTFDLDPRATLIAKVSSLEDAKLRYPEYFI